MVEIDLSLNNNRIYLGVKVESYGGRKSFEVNQENLDIIGGNIAKFIEELKSRANNGFNDSITLTGATAIPVYLIAFHIVAHSFYEVRYKNEMYNIVVAKH